MHCTHIHTARFSFLYTGINLHVEQCLKNLMQTLGEICRGFKGESLLTGFSAFF